MRKLFLIFTMCFVLLGSTYAQQAVTGVVTGDDGLSLPGVTVVQKGTSHGTITDMDGNFSLSVPSDAVIVFSFVGMETKEEAVDGRSTIDVILASSAIGLDEVVVTALGIKRDKKSLTYASQQVSGEELMKAKGANFMDALNGKAAGLEIKKSASGAGGSTRVILRGFKSLGGSSEPLYVIERKTAILRPK